MASTTDYFEESIDRAIGQHKHKESRVISLQHDLEYIFPAHDAETIATETISKISENPSDDKHALIDRMEQKLNINLDAMIAQAINIQSMHKPQTFEEMTFDKNDLHSIAHAVIRNVNRTTKNNQSEEYLREQICELNEELEFANEEINDLRETLSHLSAAKLQTVLNCSKQIDQLRTFLRRYLPLSN